MKGLSVRFKVVRVNRIKCFSNDGEGERQINLSNFPPFFELVGSRVSVKTSRFSSRRPTFCSIIARELPQIPRDPIVKSCFSEHIVGSSWPRSTMEVMELDEGDFLRVKVSEKSGITTHEELRTFLFLKHYVLTATPPLSEVHKVFEKKMKKMGKKNITERDVLDHFDFPEVLYFPW